MAQNAGTQFLPVKTDAASRMPRHSALALAIAFSVSFSFANAQEDSAQTGFDAEPAVDVEVEVEPPPEGLDLQAPFAGETLGVEHVDALEAKRMYDVHMANGQYEEALQSIELAASAAALTEDNDAVLTGQILQDWGRAFLSNNEPAQARLKFEDSVEILEAVEGVFAPSLIEPLVGLGQSLQQLDLHDEAIVTFQRAQHITHRQNGVSSLDQLPIIEMLTDSFTAKEEWEQAEDLQLLAMRIHKMEFGRGTVETVPAIHRLAEYYTSTKNYRQGRILYRKSNDVIREELGPKSPLLIDGLRGIANAYLMEQPFDRLKGLQAQQELIEIVEANPDLAVDEKIQAHLEMGDWYILFNEIQDAWGYYRLAWELANSEEAANATVDWQVRFAEPQLIDPGQDLSVEYMGYSTVGRYVYFDFEFDILDTGRPKDIRVVGSNLNSSLRTAALQNFRKARFRPRIIDGQAVATESFLVRRVYPTDPPPDYGSIAVGGLDSR